MQSYLKELYKNYFNPNNRLQMIKSLKAQARVLFHTILVATKEGRHDDAKELRTQLSIIKGQLNKLGATA